MKHQQPYRRLLTIKNEVAQRKHAVNATFTKFTKKPNTPVQQSFLDRRKLDNMNSSIHNATDETDKENSGMRVPNEDYHEGGYDFKKEIIRSNSSRGLQHLGSGKVVRKGSVHIDLTNQPLKEYQSHRNLSVNKSDSSFSKSKSQLAISTDSPRRQIPNKHYANPTKTPAINPLIDVKNTLLGIIKRMHSLEIQVNQAQKKATGVLQLSKQMKSYISADRLASASSILESKSGNGFTIEQTVRSEIDNYIIKTQQNPTYDGQGKLYNPLFKPTLQMQYVVKIEEQLGHSGSINLQYWKYYKGQFKNSKKHGKGVLVLAGDYQIEGEWSNDYLEGQILILDNYRNLVGKQTLCRPIHTPSIQ